MSTPSDVPVEIKLRRGSARLDVAYADGTAHSLPWEYLRISSPSAEVRGHGPGQEVLQTGKQDVRIVRIEPVGHYALRLIFDDGHASGLYTWRYLRELGEQQAERWQDYVERLRAAGYDR
jgi:DUF971 family protein